MRLALVFVLAALPVSAREAPAPEVVYDLAVGANADVRTFSAGAARRHAVLSARRLILGYGARASLLTGRLELHPVRGGGPERLVIDGARLATVNASVHAAYRVAGSLEAGFNVDLAGASAGGPESASYRAAPSGATANVGASPVRGNLFLFGGNDIGSLNSEFYAAWKLAPAVTVRGGLSHFLAEYRIDRDPGGGTRNFRRFMNLAFIGVRWTP